MAVDPQLPDHDGISLMRALHERQASRQQLWGSSFSVVGWVDKPTDREWLLATVRNAIDSSMVGHPLILHVEDDPDVQQIVTTPLKDNGDVVWAGTLRQATEWFQRDRFDLLILDIALPDGSGLDLLGYLGKRKSTVAVLIFSVRDVDGQVAQSVEKALVKSRTSNDELLKAIRVLLPSAARDKLR